VPSIVIPAHDEAAGIGRLLQALAPLADEAEVTVVCNGCSDNTAELARLTAPWAKVIEIEEASKPLALNTGDAASASFPRAYIDADVQIDAAAVRMLFAAVSAATPAVAATPIYDLTKSSPIVRSHYAFWSHMASSTIGISGTNAMVVSEDGRRRFQSWPNLIGDDYFLDGQFASREKQRVPAATVVRSAPHGLRDCVSRKARVHQGNVDVRDNGLRTPHEGGGLAGALAVMRNQPTLAIHFPAHVVVTVAARILARYRRSRGTAHSWYRDESRESA
jgi:glycosyltransferase involved in cell wall biosynthesis